VVPEIDNQLRGAKVGDILEFTAEHPDPDESAELRLRILVKEIKAKVLPDVDDEWANEASEFETLDALRDDLRTRIRSTKAVMGQMALRDGAARAAGELVQIEVPGAMVEGEMEHRLQDLALRLNAQGMDFESYLEASGRSRDEVVDELREAAVEAAQVDLALRAIAVAEGLEVTDADVDEELARLAERIEQPVAEVRETLEQGDRLPAVRSDLLKRKALDWLVEHVEIVDEQGATVDRGDLEVPEHTQDESEEEPA
jgi:trigger factor